MLYMSAMHCERLPDTQYPMDVLASFHLHTHALSLDLVISTRPKQGGMQDLRHDHPQIEESRSSY